MFLMTFRYKVVCWNCT